MQNNSVLETTEINRKHKNLKNCVINTWHIVLNKFVFINLLIALVLVQKYLLTSHSN